MTNVFRMLSSLAQITEAGRHLNIKHAALIMCIV